ncbi:hypothetical protein [Aeromonas veronii]|uniref:hypothetical protein n=1 Tax=Aeromonas veronii TaxID=654 RepID=UPI001880D569|nr:hypothetical protein [Aeromonas veronii]MBE8745357.1 hypothetical protein [Aeromonas veronii]
MKISLLNANEYRGLENVVFPVVVESERTEYFGGVDVLCVVMGSELLRIGGNPAQICPEQPYTFQPHSDRSCELLMPSWIDLDWIEEAAFAASAGVPIKPSLTPDQLNELLHVHAFWEMLGGNRRDVKVQRTINDLLAMVVRELAPSGVYSL